MRVGLIATSRKALVGEEEIEETAVDTGGAQGQQKVVTMDASDLAMQREAVSAETQAWRSQRITNPNFHHESKFDTEATSWRLAVSLHKWTDSFVERNTAALCGPLVSRRGPRMMLVMLRLRRTCGFSVKRRGATRQLSIGRKCQSGHGAFAVLALCERLELEVNRTVALFCW